MKKKLLALFISALMAATWLPSLNANAAELTAANPANVKYEQLSKADTALLQSLFDADYYAAQNPDVVAKYGNDKAKLFAHFVKCGIFEGRSLSTNFNVSAYASAYSDLKEKFGNNIMLYYKHYAAVGKNEDRPVTTLKAAADAGISVTPILNPEVVLTPAVIKNAEAKGITDVAAAVAAVKPTSSSSGSSESSGGGSGSSLPIIIVDSVTIDDVTLLDNSSGFFPLSS